jgi:hypothetical protein
VFLRVQRTYFRNLSYSFGRIVSAVLLGLIFGTVFWQMPYTSIIRSGARGGVIYISTLLMTIGNATAVILELNKERPVYDRERSHRMYPAFAWHLAWGVAEVGLGSKIGGLARSVTRFEASRFQLSGSQDSDLRTLRSSPRQKVVLSSRQ